MVREHRRRPEPCFGREVVGDHGHTGPQCETGRAREVRPDGGVPDNAGLPADAAMDEEVLARRSVGQQLGELRVQPARCDGTGLVENLLQVRGTQREHSECRHQLLLFQPDLKLPFHGGHACRRVDGGAHRGHIGSAGSADLARSFTK